MPFFVLIPTLARSFGSPRSTALVRRQFMLSSMYKCFLPVPLETIKELRSGSDARYYREQFQLPLECESRWITVVYVINGVYKTLHLIAATEDVFRMWDDTLRKLYAIRKLLMSGLGNIEMRQAVWEKYYWKAANENLDHKLVFEGVEKLCKRLSIQLSSEELLRLFQVPSSFLFYVPET